MDAASDRGSAAALQYLNSVLTADEKLEAWAMQRRVFALDHRRLALGATSGRFLAIVRPMFGGFDLIDVRWQDLKEVHIHVGILGATLRLSAFTGPDMATASGQIRVLEYKGLSKEPAQALYRICQAHDQAWREKRRIRDLEELRARSGGIQPSRQSQPPRQPAQRQVDARLGTHIRLGVRSPKGEDHQQRLNADGPFRAPAAAPCRPFYSPWAHRTSRRAVHRCARRGFQRSSETVAPSRAAARSARQAGCRPSCAPC